jgi:hypothetical protein
MSDSCKFRFHMGCGEPLQSRWWITQPVRALLTERQDARDVRIRNRRAAEREGGKCKS